MISTLTGGCGVDAVRHRARNGARTRRRWPDVVRLALSERSQSLEFCNKADFESVILFYVTPLYFADDPSLSDLSSQLISMVSEVRCH